MSNAISVPAQDELVQTFEIFNPASDLATVRRESGGERIRLSELIKVKIPTGGSTIWNIDTDAGVEATPSIIGVLCCVLSEGVLWPHEGDAGGGQRPVLTTQDLTTARRVGDDLGDISQAELDRCANPDGTIRWRELSYTQFGSASKGKGCRAKESRILVILRPGEVMPVLVSCPPGSLATVVPWVKRFGMSQYRHVVSLSLQKISFERGSYSQIVPTIVAKLTPEQGEVIRAAYYAPIMAEFAAAPVAESVPF